MALSVFAEAFFYSFHPSDGQNLTHPINQTRVNVSRCQGSEFNNSLHVKVSPQLTLISSRSGDKRPSVRARVRNAGVSRRTRRRSRSPQRI